MIQCGLSWDDWPGKEKNKDKRKGVFSTAVTRNAHENEAQHSQMAEAKLIKTPMKMFQI